MRNANRGDPILTGPIKAAYGPEELRPVPRELWNQVAASCSKDRTNALEPSGTNEEHLKEFHQKLHSGLSL